MTPLEEFAHLQIPLEDVKSATNNFAKQNFIRNGGFGSVYKGLLMRSEQPINVAVKRLDRESGMGDVEFWTHISMLSHLKHENLVSIIGFCDESGEKVIVNKYEIRGSLDKYLSDMTLSWLQRLHICVGVARALSYIHSDEVGRNYGVIHRNINSSKILLDDDWEAKLSGFELSIRNPTTRKHRLLLSRACGTLGYVDPVYANTGGVTYKSDCYSFGVVLFELLCGRLSVIGRYRDERRYLTLLVKRRYEEGTLDEVIHPNLRKQMEKQSLSVFSETAYDCLKEQRAQRPDMNQIVKKLEKALEFQRRFEKPLIPKETPRKGTSSNHLKGKDLEHLKIPLKDIKLATGDFDDMNCIGSGGYGMVYKAELDHFDNEKSYGIEGMNKCELPKRRSTVAIKRIYRRLDGQGEEGFLKEIETLTSCKHHNIVSLLGFCDEDAEMILVYEHAYNGSLDDYLENINEKVNLTWAQRLRICLDIAHGLHYLHQNMEDKEKIIHRDIKSANVLLGKNWEAKIADFGLSRFGRVDQQASYLQTYVAGTKVYLDPEYAKTGILRKESDIYSLGVMFFEILCGKLAYDQDYIADNDRGFSSMARRCFEKGTLKEMIDPKIKEETDQNTFTLSKGPNKESLDTFSTLAYQCLEETQAARPQMEVVIKELEKALDFQVNRTDILQLSLEDIKLATENFDDKNLIGRGAFGKVYRGEVLHDDRLITIAVKRRDKRLGQGEQFLNKRRLGGVEQEFLNELDILFECKHKNIISLVGYCNKTNEEIIVYEHISNGSLDKYLNDASLTWTRRLKICIDAANGLDFLHAGVVTQERVIHRDIKSSNILLDHDWNAKITDFGLSMICPINQDMDYVFDNVVGTIGYVDPLYIETGVVTKESDIYSFGVVLFEIMSGRLVSYVDVDGEYRSLLKIFKGSFEVGKLDWIILNDIKAQIVPESLSIVSAIAYQCLHTQKEKRPTAVEVVVQLKKALDFQEDYEIWENKLPKNYKEIIQMSKSPEIYSTMTKKNLYNALSKGILLQEGKVWFSLSIDGEKNEMISSTMFSYKNPKSHKSRSLRRSRFRKVAQMLDISNLKIQIQITTQFLSPGITYGAHLVFKFRYPRKVSTTPMYVNLKYKMGCETLHSYFATRREDKWMMIELCRFLNHKETTDFEVLLESFSQNNCGNGAIYVEGIEFRVIDNVEHQEHKKLVDVNRVLKSNSDKDVHVVQQLPIDEGEKFLWLSKVNGKKCHMLPTKMVLYDYSNLKRFAYKHSSQSRFQEVVELLSHQVFRIKCKIESQMLSLDTKYACFFVFKLSEKCHGLQCPVKVRDLLHEKNIKTKILYFRTPSLLNLHDITWVPRQREDGWMEVIVWELNSNYKLNNGYLPMDLKFICYEGTMCGLIVGGLEFRPI